MPSLTHEALLLLFRNRPELAPELLRDALHVELPVYTEVRVESADLTDVVPAEYRADLVVLLVDGKPVLGIVVEVQFARDERKRYTWPVYVAGVRARFECPATVLAIAATMEVARWAAQPVALGPGGSFCPLVVGPEAVPVVTDPGQASADPELAVLSVMAHGGGDVDTAVRIALAAEPACAGLPDDRVLIYSDLIRSSLGEAARKAFEEFMANSPGYEYQSEFARRHRAEGQAEGQAEGRAEGAARALLVVLEARGLVLSDEQRRRIEASADVAELEDWVRRAATVATAAELFD
jgi:hypothetical protein